MSDQSKVTQIEYLAADGKTTFKIEISESLDRAIAVTYIDGKYDFEGLPRAAPVGAPADVVASIGRIGLKQDRYNEVMAAINARQTQIDACPDVQMRKLVAQRRQLVAEINYILADQHEEHQDRIARASATGIYRPESRDYATEEAAARKVLADFDAAHPEVIDKISADKQADIARFLANN